MARQKRITKSDEPRQCYAIMESQRDEHGYIPSLVTEDESGHSPLRGRGPGSSPWYWGKTYQRAQEICDRQNLTHFGINRRTALKIIASSMKAGNL